MPHSLWRLCIPLVLAIATCRADEPSSPWSDEALVARRFEEAIAAVEKHCGHPFQKRPVVVRSHTEEVEAILVRELGDFYRALDMEASLEPQMNLVAKVLLAKYEPATHTIHLLPENVDRLAKLLARPGMRGEPSLRVTLAHEVVHAHDFERYSLEKRRDAARTLESMQAFGAVLEGHAQFVAARIARGWGLERAFDEARDAITALPPGLDASERFLASTVAAEISFGYVQGLAFFEELFRLRGEKGVEAALRAPPDTTRVIERPALFQSDDAGSGGADLLERILAPSRELCTGEGWTHQSVRPTRFALQAQFQFLTSEEQATALDGFEEASVQISMKGDSALFAIALFRFDGEESATRFLAIERRVSEAKDKALTEGAIQILSALYEEGIGVPSDWPGFRANKTVSASGEEVPVAAVIGRAGSFVLEISASGETGAEAATLSQMAKRLLDAVAATVK